MKKIISTLLFLVSFVILAQSNSSLYEDKSIIKIKALTDELNNDLENFDVTYLSCRNHGESSVELIVDQPTLQWLTESNLVFETIVEDVKQKIDIENSYMNSIRSQRDGSAWYNVYRTYDEVQDKLIEIADSYDIATLINLGDSYENRAINGIKLSTGGAEKPSLFFNGCQHAREWVTVMATTYLADELSQSYDSDSYINTLLNLVDIYIVPIVNPDGYVYSHTTDRYWRKNRQPNVGSSCIGTDLNRNWDADWDGGESTSTSSCSDIYVGTNPFSAVEASIVKNYMESIPHLVGHLDIHSYSALVLGPWGYSNSPTPDHDEVVSLGNAMNDAITNTNNYSFTFGTGDANGSIYLASGTMPDWSYDGLGVLGYTYELRPSSASEGGFELPIDQIMDACEENYNGVLEMITWAADVQSGCMDVNACNYDATATIDDGSCAEFDECGECGGNGPTPGYDCEGNCISGELLTITMSDSYGDGWNGNTLNIEGLSFSFEDGYESSAEMCFDAGSCYIVECNGGTWQSEVTWEITNASNEILLTGGAPYEGELGDCVTPLPTVSDTQTIDLPVGWYIFSTYIEPVFTDIAQVVSDIANSVVIIKDIEGNAYLPGWEWDAIGNIENKSGYLIKLTESEELVIQGTKINPETYNIELNEGWSLIGYLRDSSANLVEMLSPIQENIIIVKSFDGAAYLPDWDYNGIGNMVSGEGYQIKVNANVSFTYPAN